MASFDYAKAQATALRLITQFGESITISRTSSTYDPVTGVETNEILATSPATVVSLPATSGTTAPFDNGFKEDVKKGKLRFFYIAASGLTLIPEAGDLFTFQDQTWDIAGATPLNPAGTALLYTAGCRSSGRVITGQEVDNIACFNLVENEW